MTKSAYIHIPFCKSKCFYCSFVSFDKLELVESFIKALDEQITTEYKGEILNTLYLGGGTPSLLSPEQIKHILSHFNLSKQTEVTMEANPNDLSLDYLEQIRQLGINRLSIGVQSFDDSILKAINRRHNSKQALEAVEWAKKAGFENISLDFIYGLPNQTIEMFANDLKLAISLDIQHISLYGLKIDSDCYFAKHKPVVPDEDTQADMFLTAIGILNNNNFEHYEISNFSKKGYNSRHNLNYWNAENYYGFGCAASGYVGNYRYTNLLSVEDYIKNPLSKYSKCELSEQEQLEEKIFLGFRKFSGIDVEEINKQFNIDFNKKYSDILSSYDKYFVKTKKGYAFNVDGALISNVILADFIEC